MSETSSSVQGKFGEQKPRRTPRRMKAAIRCRYNRWRRRFALVPRKLLHNCNYVTYAFNFYFNIMSSQ